MKSFWIAVALASAVFLTLPRGAAAEGWSWGNWFGGNKKSETKKSTSNTSLMGRPKKSSPAYLTESSKNFFAPVQGIKQPSAKSKSGTGLQATRSKTRPPEKPPFWKSWFVQEEPKQPRTVGEWMSQPRLNP